MSHKWSLPFPMAIAKNLKFLVIIQTVHFIESGSDTDDKQPNKSCVSPQISSVRLPEIHEEVQIAEAESRKAPVKGGSQMRLALPYSYQISQDCQYLLRQELKYLTTVAVAVDPTMFALTAIAIDQTGYDCQIIGRFGSFELPAQLGSCSIHPSLPLALFYSRGFGGPRSILLWMFENNSSLELGPEDSYDEICSPPHAAEYLHFSACGTNIIIKSPGEPLPNVISIQGHPLYELAGQRRSFSQHSSKTHANLAGTMGLSSVSQSQSSLVIPNRRMELGQAIVEGSTLYNINLSLGNSERTIQAIQSSGGTKVTQSILSLPDSWKDVDKSVRVSVDSAVAKENHIQIMMHQTSKAWYNPTETPELHFPMMVHKNTAAIVRPEHTVVRAGKKRNAAVMLDHSEKEEVGDISRAIPRQKMIQE
jgi:hypothetical protein